MRSNDQVVLPDGWSITALGKMMSGERRTINPARKAEQAFELYSVPSFDSGLPEMVKGGSIGSNKQLVEPDTVLLCKINPRINRVWIVGNHSDCPKIASTEWIPFALREGIVPKYLCYFLQNADFREYLAANVSGVGGSLMRARTSAIEDYPVPIAPIELQSRIVEELDKQFTRLNAGIESLKQIQVRLQRYRASILKAACAGQLVAQDPADEPASALLRRILAERRAQWPAGKKYVEPEGPDAAGLPELPAGWCWATVEQLAAHEPNSITDGPFGSNLKTEHYTSEGPRVVRLQNIGDGFFRDEEAHISAEHFARLTRHQIFANDVIIAALGDEAPRACLVPPTLGPAIVKADCIRFKPHHHLMDPRYANFALNSKVVKAQGARIIHGIGRPRLNQQEIRNLCLPVPPLAEQARIVAEVERRLSVVGQLAGTVAANVARAGRLRQAVLKAAFEGRLGG